jgi:hypothetical protein
MKCNTCGKEKTKIIKLTEEGFDTITETEVCENKNCSFYINISKVTTWARKKTENQ